MSDKWEKRFEFIMGFGWMALAGFVVALTAIFIPSSYRPIPLYLGLFLILPAFVYTYVVVIWHWKDRYRGNHPDLWGALILIEPAAGGSWSTYSVTSVQTCGIAAAIVGTHSLLKYP